MVGRREVEGDTRRVLHALVVMELGAVVESQRLHIEAFQQPDQSALNAIGMLALQVTDSDESRRPLQGYQQIAGVVGALDEIDLPVPKFFALIDFRRPLTDAHSILDRKVVRLAPISLSQS